MLTFVFPRWLNGKESACQCRRHRRLRFTPWVGKIPGGRKWQTTPVFLPGNFHRQKSLVGYSPWCHKRVRTQLSMGTNIWKPVPIISKMLCTVNDTDIDKCFVFILSFPRNLCLHSGLKDSTCCPSTVCFFSKYKQFYPFQFILVISSGSWICIQIYQNLSLGIFLYFLFSHSP